MKFMAWVIGYRPLNRYYDTISSTVQAIRPSLHQHHHVIYKHGSIAPNYAAVLCPGAIRTLGFSLNVGVNTNIIHIIWLSCVRLSSSIISEFGLLRIATKAAA